MPAEAEFRLGLKQRFFKAVDGVEIHCDDDFVPLTLDRVVLLLVKTLAKQKQRGCFESYTPLFATLYSHESKSIQIADIIAGMVESKIDNKEFSVLRPLPLMLVN